MKKVIGIYCGDFTYNGKYWDSDIVRSEGAGGSEIWAVEIASEFRKFGFHVIVFCCCEYWHFDNEGVEYVPYTLFNGRIQYQHFDYFISSRRAEEITPDFECPNIYLMSHEIGIFNKYWGNFETFEGLKMDKVKKIGVLSEWHKKATLKLYPQLREEQLFVTYNGIDQSLYKDVDHHGKRNMMVWSMALNRGMTFFGKYVLPKILKEVPDFELNICSYNLDIKGTIPEGPNVHFLGTLTRPELAELQKQAKIWILPNYGYNDFGKPLHESFCMSAVENALAGNAIVCFNKDGLTTTLEGYEGIINADWFDDSPESREISEEEYERLAESLASEAVNLLTNPEARRMRVAETAEICSKYTWKNSAMTWLKEWGLIYE